jgi:hypothetical protein
MCNTEITFVVTMRKIKAILLNTVQIRGMNIAYITIMGPQYFKRGLWFCGDEMFIIHFLKDHGHC